MAGDRFEFGRNWDRYLRLLTPERIADAEGSLSEKLGGKLDGLTFLDAGSGSGLFSLAARKLGARVSSFDLDPDSVACTRGLRDRFGFDDSSWAVHEGSVLDREFLERLGQFDIVYSWGVLHHTGEMWKALDNVARLVSPSGRLFIAIYNDQGIVSGYWLGVKRLYNWLPRFARWPLVLGVGAYFTSRNAAARIIRGRFRGDWRKKRGMTVWYDLVDWVGGYPFEVARPDVIFAFLKQRGFDLDYMTSCAGRHGCNEYIFRRAALR